ncbi:MAG: hypothetical protein CMM01_11280 [Rhodopirellula sp.]|nr:hypothetical protein [Rhodopirellula sp.]
MNCRKKRNTRDSYQLKTRLKYEGYTKQGDQQATRRWDAPHLLDKERQERQRSAFSFYEEPQKVSDFFGIPALTCPFKQRSLFEQHTTLRQIFRLFWKHVDGHIT